MTLKDNVVATPYISSPSHSSRTEQELSASPNGFVKGPTLPVISHVRLVDPTFKKPAL